jgi:hypothetical protein
MFGILANTLHRRDLKAMQVRAAELAGA